MIAVVLILVIAIGFGCTQNQRAVGFGGTAHVTVPPDRKFVNCTWKIGKDTVSLWILTRDRKAGDSFEKFYFNESSNFGILQGEVVITEQK